MTLRICLFIAGLILASSTSYASKEVKVPDPLKPWVDWVLHDKEEHYHCIPDYNMNSQLKCNWPTELRLDVSDKNALFNQRWLVNYESWVTLPGDNSNWPVNVTVNKEPAIVLNRNGRPQIKLQKGAYIISGEYKWNILPEFLQIPANTALVSMKVRNKTIDFPNIDDQGKLWLQAQKKTEEKIENKLIIQSYRLIDDRIPPRVVLYLNLEVAGSAREVVLGAPFSPDKFIPVSLTSSLPARVEQDGRIRVQIRPGQWNLKLTARHLGNVYRLEFIRPESKHWPKEEIWSFKAHTDLRIVEIEGATSIDPKQTTLPEKWNQYPAFRMLPEDVMIFKEIKRGDPSPAPDQLTLQRDMWLKFDGSGYTIQDRIQGKKHNNWRLEMSPSIQLGRVVVNGSDQFITVVEDSAKAGVEIRQGNLTMTADSEYYGRISTIPATAWDHTFQKVETRLHMPPGYRLLSASGVDNMPRTWITRWTLLDLFVVLIFSISIAKLFSVRFALLAFITMVLLYHEPGAPRYVWLALLVGIALLRHLPEGKFRRFIKFYQVVVTVILIFISIPFAIKELRVGIYPQLEKPYHFLQRSMGARKAAPQMAQAPAESKDELQEMRTYEDEGIYDSSTMLRSRTAKRIGDKVEFDSYGWSGRSQVAQYDPSMVNQTGPGLPQWQFNTVFMSAGPVKSDQEISLRFIGPKANLVLAFIRVGLLILLALGLFGVRYQKGSGWHLPSLKTFMLILLFFCMAFPSISSAEGFPSPDMLKELQKRLLETDECFPNCADITKMAVDISTDNLNIELNVDSQIASAISLPGSIKHWLPQSVTIDGKKADALFKTYTGLWTLVPEGNHKILLSGKLPKFNTIQLQLPLKPHHVSVKTKGWTVEGIRHDGSVDNQLQFKRITDEVSLTNQILDTGVLPPFALVERTLLLGLDWKINTRISRISPAGSAIVLEIPLIPGESVITEAVEVINGKARINLGPNSRTITWDSVLNKASEITLKHSDTNDWTEIWQVDVSPIFHMEYDGIPVILHKQGDRWFPKWHPWPNETVTLHVTRPTGVEGQTLTIDRSHLDVRPGLRVTDSQLTLSIRSSQGGQHTIIIPEGAQLQEVLIGGKVQPIRQEGRDVPIPIVPGAQDVVLKWRSDDGVTTLFKSPEVDLQVRNANANMDIHLPYNRWPLILMGPELGPAVLFWSVVIVILLASFGLSLTKLTPLKFHHWFLLGIGMSQSSVVMSFIIVVWLFAFHYRGTDKSNMDKRAFNFLQIGLTFLTVFAIASLVGAISNGLLGAPDMSIVGNGSSNGLLRWYSDYNDNMLPTASVISIPMFNYRLAMLLWALWISFSLIWILKWCWGNYSHPVLWYSIPRKKKDKNPKDIVGSLPEDRP